MQWHAGLNDGEPGYWRSDFIDGHDESPPYQLMVIVAVVSVGLKPRIYRSANV